MNIKTLKEELSKYDENAEVKLHGPMGNSVLLVLGKSTDKNTIWLQSKEDFDVENELSAKFDHYLEKASTDVVKQFIIDCLKQGFDYEAILNTLSR